MYLYEIEVYEVTSDKTGHDCPKAQSFVVESAQATWNSVKRENVLPPCLQDWVNRRAHEASVQWGFVPVDVIVAHLMPARIMASPKDNSSCVRSILFETRVHVERVKS